MGKAEGFLITLDFSTRKAFFMAFVLGFVVRMIPELLSLPHPIGFDTIYYAWRIESGIVWSHWSEVFSSWLPYGVLATPGFLLEIDSFLLLKLIMPLAFGLNTSGMYHMATKTLGWSVSKSLFAAGLFSFQLAALRISWDLYRNLLGMGILLFTLPMMLSLKGRRNFLLFAVLSVLVTLSHEFSAVILLWVVFWALFFERRLLVNGGRMLIAVIPSLCIFLANLFFLTFPIASRTEPYVVEVGDVVNPRPFGLTFLVDYFRVSNSVQNYSSYIDLALDVMSLFALLFLALMPLILFGVYRDRILDSWSSILIIGSFSCLVIPFCALDMWSRWMLMLVYPFTFYAANGSWKVLGAESSDNASKGKTRKTIHIAKATLPLIVLLGISFMAAPMFFGRFSLFSIPTISNYFPPTMQVNTVPLEDVDDVAAVLNWLSENRGEESCLLVHHALISWARLYLREPCTMFHFQIDLNMALESAMDAGFRNVYFVWWNEDIGWYGVNASPDFVVIFSSSRMAAFKYSLG